LPSSNIVKWLFYYFFKANDELSYDYLSKYLVLCSINNLYSKATNQQLKKDINFTKILLEKKINLNEEINNIFETEFNITCFTKIAILETSYTQKSSFYKLIASRIKKISSDFTQQKLDNEDPNILEYHHIFPLKCKINNKFLSDTNNHNINSIANITFLTEETNKKISNQSPKEIFNDSYNYPELKEKIERLKGNWNYFKNNQFEDFINERANNLAIYFNKEFKLIPTNNNELNQTIKSKNIVLTYEHIKNIIYEFELNQKTLNQTEIIVFNKDFHGNKTKEILNKLGFDTSRSRKQKLKNQKDYHNFLLNNHDLIYSLIKEQ